MTDQEIALSASPNSVTGDMIYQMLSRGTYNHQKIAKCLGCPIETVARIASKRAKDIEKNHQKYQEARKVSEALLASPSSKDRPSAPDSTIGFVRNVSLFNGTVFGRGHALHGDSWSDWN